MKKTIKLAILFLSALLSVLSVTACSVFSNQPDNGGTNNSKSSYAPKNQTITVYNDETPTTYTVTLGEVAQIDIFTKPDYYFVGAFDAAEGGTKYFDGNGNSTMVWGAGNPDTYYTRFESIYNLTYTDKQLEEDPFTWDGTSERYITFEFNQELKSAISSNLDATLNISISVDISCDDSWTFQNINLKTLKSGGETYTLGYNEKLIGGTYKTFAYSQAIPAKLLQSGKLYLYLKGLESNFLTRAYYHYKNIALTITFDQAV